jgi:hypothetical protein
MYPVNLSEKKKTKQNGKKENIQVEGLKRGLHLPRYRP